MIQVVLKVISKRWWGRREIVGVVLGEFETMKEVNAYLTRLNVQIK